MQDISQKTAERLACLQETQVVAAISGGKDSTAMCLWLTEQGIEHCRVFADTGWEAPETYAYLDKLRERFGPIDVVRNEALWTDARAGEGGMLTLIRKKQMFPSRTRRFCTEYLKLKPLKAYIEVIGDDGPVINAIGIRAAESQARASLPEWEWNDDFGCQTWRPLIRWTEQDVIDIHARHGLAPNPLYLSSAKRVGCYPCIFSSKEEIAAIPEEVSPQRGAPRAVVLPHARRPGDGRQRVCADRAGAGSRRHSVGRSRGEVMHERTRKNLITAAAGLRAELEVSHVRARRAVRAEQAFDELLRVAPDEAAGDWGGGLVARLAVRRAEAERLREQRQTAAVRLALGMAALAEAMQRPWDQRLTFLCGMLQHATAFAEPRETVLEALDRALPNMLLRSMVERVAPKVVMGDLAERMSPEGNKPALEPEPICSVCCKFAWNEADRRDDGDLLCNSCAQAAAARPARLNRRRPPPGYDLLVDANLCFRWYVCGNGPTGPRGEACQAADQAIHLAWNRYEAGNNPPGIDLWPGEFGVEFGVIGDVVAEGVTLGGIGDIRPTHPSNETWKEARTAAWAAYWRRVAAVAAAEGARCKFPAWPQALSFTDKAVTQAERTFAAVANLERLDQRLSP